jgi:replicative DNA helicase
VQSDGCVNDLPPASLDAEESVLGAMLLNERAIDPVLDSGLKDSDYYRESHGVIHRAILALYARSSPVDAITVSDELERTGLLSRAGGIERIHELAALVPAYSNAGHYAKIVREAAVKRDVIALAQDLVIKAHDGVSSEELLASADSRILDLQSRKNDKGSVYTGKQLAERYRYRMEHPEEFESTITPPFYFLEDQIVNGQLHILAGYQGTGKTALLWQFAEAALEQGKKVAIWTLEMTPDQLTDRLVKSHGAEKAMEMLERWDVEIINDSVVTPESIRRLQRKNKYDLILIDHLHRFPIKNPAHVRIEIAEMVKKLTNVALEFNVPIILLCQLSRATLHDPFPRPTTAQLKETSQIETDAAVIWMVWRKFDGFQFKHEAEFITAKHRFGSPGWKRLNFIARQVRFEPA